MACGWYEKWADIAEAEADRLASGGPINWGESHHDPEYETVGILYTVARLLRQADHAKEEAR